VGQILSRAADLTKSFLEIWPRPVPLAPPEEDSQLTAILDVPRRPGFYPGWDTEFAYAVFRGETLEVRNIKELFLQVLRRLLAERRDDVLACNPGLFSPIAKNPQYELIARDPDLFANKAIFPGWQLKYLQDVVDELDVADDLLVRFASDEADDDVIESFAEHEEATDDSGTAELTDRLSSVDAQPSPSGSAC
jgi:hypothetical protein